MDAPEKYMKELRSELALYPTWLPSDPIELGAYGTFVRGKFVVDGRLADIGVEIVTREHPASGNLKRSRGIKYGGKSSTHAEAELVDATAGVELAFEREHAWAFGARGVRTVEIVNIAQVRDAVMEDWKTGHWKREWLVVTEYRRADRLNVLIAKSKSVSVRVVAKGTIAAADALVSEDAAFEYRADDVFEVTNCKHATPLFGLRKLRGIFDPGLKPVNAGGAGDDDELLETAKDESFHFA